MHITKAMTIVAIAAIAATAVPAGAAYGATSDERAATPAGTSVYTTMPRDDGAVVLGSEEFPVHGDGVGDDTAVIQAAIDEASRRGGENWLGNIVAPARGLDIGDGGGVVFVPEGRYRVSARIDLHASVRVIGFGAERPEFVVAPETPAFGTGQPEFVFAATRRPVDFSGAVSFGNNDTFGTGLVNVDLTVGPDNPDAIGVRFGGAQMFLLQDVDIDMGDGYAGIDHNANLMQRVNVRGGRVGLLAYAASPGWQTTIMDSSFTDQSEVAILLHTDAKLSLVRTLVADTPRGIVANPGQSQRLHIQESVFERITGPAITMNDSESLPAATGEVDLIRAQNQLNVVDTGVIDTGALLQTQPSGRTWAVPGPASLVKDATLGLRVTDALGADEQRTDEVHVMTQPVGRAALNDLLRSDVPLPPPSSDWVSVVDFAEASGLQVGQGADDTAVFQAAIDAHHTVYVPLGKYSVNDTLRLGRDDNLIGLHPRQTWLTLPDHAAAFADRDAPAAIVETPDQGTNVVSGIGLDTNATNPGAAQVRWRSGPESLLSDIATQFVKWAPDVTAPGEPGGGDPGYAYRGETRYNFWVDGGGGTFVNLWAIAGYADNGFFAENTKVPATLYQLSIEHHRYREVVLHDVTGWEFHALQTEDHIYGWESQAVEIVDSRDIRFANTVFFRVATVLGPHPYAIGIERSTDIVVRGTRGYRDTNIANTRWGATIRDIETGREVPEIDVAYLAVGGHEPGDSPSGLQVTPADPLLGPAPGSVTTTSLNIDNPDPLPMRDMSVTAVADSDIEVAVEAPSRIHGGSSADVPLSISVPADAQLGTAFRIEITVTGVAGDRHYAVPLEVSGVVGGTNLALSATVSATSTQGTNVAANVNDDVTAGARWVSTAADPAPALTFELAQPAVVNRAVLFTGVTGSTALRVVAAEVSGLIGGQWMPLGSIAGSSASPAAISLDSSLPVTAVRVDFTQPSPTDSIARVFEVQLYGSPR